VLFTAAVLLAGAYAVSRDIPGRYAAHEQRERDLDAMQENVRQAETMLEREARQAQELGSNSLELEASIRRWKRYVRPGEKIFRVELPSDAGIAGARP